MLPSESPDWKAKICTSYISSQFAGYAMSSLCIPNTKIHNFHIAERKYEKQVTLIYLVYTF